MIRSPTTEALVSMPNCPGSRWTQALDPRSGIASLGPGPHDVEQILDEADWMVQRGQRAEARVLLEQQLQAQSQSPTLARKAGRNRPRQLAISMYCSRAMTAHV